jgi:hypothetical protein
VIDASCIEDKESGFAESRPEDSIDATFGELPLAGDEHLQIGPAERVERAANVGIATVMSDAPADRRGSEAADDSGQGLAMFVIFTGAVLIVTGAVALLAVVGSWWMLGVAFAVHVTMTVVVVLTILYAMGGRTRATADRDRPSRGMFTTVQIATQSKSVSPPSAFVDDRASASPTGRDVRRPAPSSQVAPVRPRVLMVTDENLATANEVPELIRPLVDLAKEVYVVAPTLTTRLQSLTGDVDPARARAEERLQTVFDHMHADGVRPDGAVADEDQVSAIADALTGFDADLMVLRLHARGSENENWRERRLAKQVRSRFDVPTIVFYFDSHGRVVGREEGQAVTPACRRPSENRPL